MSDTAFTPAERERLMCDAIRNSVATAVPGFGTVTLLAGQGAEASANFPFCDTSKCPFWRGYCSRDPACDD